MLRPSFNPVREYVLGGDRSGILDVRKYSAGREYGPFHILSLRPIDTHLSVQIRLFRWLTTEVVFNGIQYKGIDPVYFEDLELRRSLLAPDHEHAAANQWIDIGSH